MFNQKQKPFSIPAKRMESSRPSPELMFSELSNLEEEMFSAGASFGTEAISFASNTDITFNFLGQGGRIMS